MVQYNSQSQFGFTIIEIIVASAIFVVVVTGMLSLFNNVLQINRRVQTIRELVQGTRSFTESVTREVRNGRIDYSSYFPECNVNYYTTPQQSLGIIARNGDKLCFYLDGQGHLILEKHTSSGDGSGYVFDQNRFKIDPATFKFIVQPKIDPNPDVSANPSAPVPAVQPFVTVIAQLQLLRNTSLANSTINYETTISTDVYDVVPLQRDAQ